jgi:hypothetical protein
MTAIRPEKAENHISQKGAPPDRSDEPDEGDPGKGNEEQSDERHPARVLLEVEVSDLLRAAPGRGPFPDEQR